MGFFLKESDLLSLRGRHLGIHNFSYGCLACYFYLTDPNSTIFWDDSILTIRSPFGKTKTWIFNNGNPDDLALYRKQGPCYSLAPLNVPGQSLFPEPVYDLNEVFDPDSYPNKKKRYQRIVYPPKWMERYQFTVTDLTVGDLPEIRVLHDKWVEHKLAQESTYKLLFPRRRYYRCCELAAAQPDLFASFVVRNPLEEIVACRVLYREGAWAFDLAQFASDQVPSNATEYFASATMRLLYEAGVRWINTGSSLNSALSQYKSHWPHQVRTHWTYSQQKST